MKKAMTIESKNNNYINNKPILTLVSEYREQYGDLEKGIEFIDVNLFQKIILEHYNSYKREFPWRDNCTAYEIFISEVMLQQTQTERVIEKYKEFIRKFSDINELATASLGEVITLWQGLGYNRRAGFLHRAAQMILTDYDGIIPNDPHELIKLPGIGKATAASIAAFAYDEPAVFIETNIRTVFIYFFFNKEDEVSDEAIFPLVELTLFRDSPSKWYSALMDFGVMLKKNRSNPSRKSKHYVKQSPFKGSRREVRGKILRLLASKDVVSFKKILSEVSIEKDLLKSILDDLQKEGLIIKRKQSYLLP